MEFVQARAARLLVKAAETFPAMLAVIDAAVDRVDLETYTLRDDSTGRTFQQAMIRAALRGVRVRLLYDWIGSFTLARAFVGELIEAGVKVAVYHPLLVRRPVWALNRRDHRRIFIPSKPVRRANTGRPRSLPEVSLETHRRRPCSVFHATGKSGLRLARTTRVGSPSGLAW